MNAARFIANTAMTGTIAGVGLGASQEQIRDKLGNQCIADQRRRSLRLDYGLLEFNLFAGFCETVAVQIHRLAYGAEGLIPAVLSWHFQEPLRVISFEAVRNEIDAHGTHLVEEHQRQEGYRCYRVAESHVDLYVVDAVTREGDPFAPGDLWSIMISGRA